jgi:hypothetical protein
MRTPGPWIAWDDGYTVGIVRDGKPFAVAEVVDHGDITDPAQLLGDQLLVTAAPDMLAALKEAIHAVAAYKGRLSVSPIKGSMDLAAKAERLQRRIDATLAKAEGRS